jgi:hypothetical protein
MGNLRDALVTATLRVFAKRAINAVERTSSEIIAIMSGPIFVPLPDLPGTETHYVQRDDRNDAQWAMALLYEALDAGYMPNYISKQDLENYLYFM